MLIWKGDNSSIKIKTKNEKNYLKYIEVLDCRKKNPNQKEKGRSSYYKLASRKRSVFSERKIFRWLQNY
jgi:hypothetical protein